MLLSITSCKDVTTPKPMGYYRIEFPEKEYDFFDEDAPFTCLIPVYSQMQEITDTTKNVRWFNLNIPKYDATIHLSYHNINQPLNVYLESTRDFVYRHMDKASSIETTEIIINNNNVYGLVYNINGSEAASPTQFYLTDSTTRFLRGALYFSHKPNNDSVAPIIEFINKDIMMFIRTLQWN
ncbi:MAG: hypothetical protein ACOX4D_01880 [Bacteroidales bacterium]